MLKAKAERIYTIEFTEFEKDEIDYDEVDIPDHEAWITRLAKRWVLKGYPDADHIVIKVQTFLHEPKEKTYLDDLLEKFPNIAIRNGVPAGCVKHLYFGTAGCIGLNTPCADCWNSVMPKGGEDDEG